MKKFKLFVKKNKQSIIFFAVLWILSTILIGLGSSILGKKIISAYDVFLISIYAMPMAVLIFEAAKNGVKPLLRILFSELAKKVQKPEPVRNDYKRNLLFSKKIQ